MEDKSENISVLRYEGALPDRRFIDDFVSKDIPNNNRYGSFRNFQGDLNTVKKTAEIMCYDDAETVNRKLSTADKTLNALILKINDSYQEMINQSKLYNKLNAGGLGLGGLGTIGGYMLENGWLLLLGLGVAVTSATFLLSINDKRKRLGVECDYILDECKTLEETIAENKSKYLAK